MTSISSAKSPGGRSAARDRLLATAGRLFYKEGIRAVGVDRVMAEADVARATMYRHFPGKDDLVRAYLKSVDTRIKEQLESARENLLPSEFLMAMAEGIGKEICGADFHGCPFIKAASEFPDPQSPVHQVVIDHRSWFRSLLQDAFYRLDRTDAAERTDLMVALRDGAMIAGYLEDPQKARTILILGVRHLVEDDTKLTG
ncbi:TetR/AcrR family transcriptional regulator (plasmid) [Streptomyces sp. AHU1]|uniref:TetR/AcrR family transcriptional regulator n=1 Tax=Streptomyces sp. AHU1 TaxID=3377215 RepID=UPI0038779678